MSAESSEVVHVGLVAAGALALKRFAFTYSSVAEQLLVVLRRMIYSRPNQVVIDGVMVSIALSASYLLRFDGVLPSPYLNQLLQVIPFAVVLCLIVNILFGVYKQTWRFFGLQEAMALGISMGTSSLISLVWRIGDPGFLAGTPVPFGVLLIFPVVAFGAMAGVRLARRVLYDRPRTTPQTLPLRNGRKRLLLAGAGEAGLHLLQDLRKMDVVVVGLVDDDRRLTGRTIGGWRVLGTTYDLESVIRAHRVDEVILSMPSAPRAVAQRIVARCAEMNIKTSSVPGLWEIMSGRAAIGQIKPVTMEELLGRLSVTHAEDLAGLAGTYSGKAILVTGAGGSIGSELVRQLRRFQPSKLILLDKDENNLYEIACEIREDFDAVVEVVGDIRNKDVLQRTFRLHTPEVVFHAAAYKHVPLMEQYPAEAILNNVMGTKNVVELSNALGVRMFVFISSDKAVNPSSTMGASKRVAEMIVQDLASRDTTRTRFCCVRFGNVLGSRASVVPIFQRQIRQGRNITVTHPDVTRYFMTIPEAVHLVIQAGSLGKKGEIFLLDMGDPVRIVDLARNLIELSGLVPGQDVAIEFTGLRPGEKLKEELLTAGERTAGGTRYSKIFVVGALDNDWSQLQTAIGELQTAAQAGDTAAIHRILRALNIGYHTQHGRGEKQSQAPNIEDVERKVAGTPPALIVH